MAQTIGKRRAKARARAIKAQVLVRIDLNARKLWSSGANTVGSYGEAAQGVSPTQIKFLRRTATIAMDVQFTGVCKTTALAMLDAADPLVDVPVRQMEHWVKLAPLANQERLHTAWVNAKVKLCPALKRIGGRWPRDQRRRQSAISCK